MPLCLMQSDSQKVEVPGFSRNREDGAIVLDDAPSLLSHLWRLVTILQFWVKFHAGIIRGMDNLKYAKGRDGHFHCNT